MPFTACPMSSFYILLLTVMLHTSWWGRKLKWIKSASSIIIFVLQLFSYYDMQLDTKQWRQKKVALGKMTSFQAKFFPSRNLLRTLIFHIQYISNVILGHSKSGLMHLFPYLDVKWLCFKRKILSTSMHPLKTLHDD